MLPAVSSGCLSYAIRRSGESFSAARFIPYAGCLPTADLGGYTPSLIIDFVLAFRTSSAALPNLADAGSQFSWIFIGRIRVSKGLVLSFALLFACVTNTAVAQETINYASISGRVSDSTGAIIQGAQVSARQTETNITNTTATEADGRFRF